MEYWLKQSWVLVCLFQFNLKVSKPFFIFTVKSEWKINITLLITLVWNTVYWLAYFPGKNNTDLEESATKSLEPKAPRIKEVLKERKVLEKKVALSKKRRKDSRYLFYLALSNCNTHLNAWWFQKKKAFVVVENQTFNVYVNACLWRSLGFIFIVIVHCLNNISK